MSYMFFPEEPNVSKAERRAFSREELIFNVTEDLLVKLEELDISKAELARRLGKSKSCITQMLNGSRNMTLGTFSDICFELGFKPEVKIPLQKINKIWEPDVKDELKIANVTKLHLKVIDSGKRGSWTSAPFSEMREAIG
ncbi:MULTISPECIES: helix-turn-helix transcriptional regulator [Pseudoalteromonas]|nr:MULTISPECIES: helix-turn-helix domain-containing protein [Pseudoalteromonas]MCG9758779.1 helix-turn-helix transcriptional regulator [Pseudoalteromonas sp. Isolate6]WOX30006.1 helix-turn-helix domain-containing protein [Pseudoalteromonas maricaloris]